MQEAELINYLKRIKTIADLGLQYGSTAYDKERYTELLDIYFSIVTNLTGDSIQKLKNFFPENKEYPTAKVDIRSVVLSEADEILLVQESSDSRWSLPGGWAEIGFTPHENIVKECKEETGLDVIPLRLLAVFDKKMHNHPSQQYYIYKLIFHCKATSTAITKGFDVLDVKYFPLHALPSLSENRILRSQIEIAVNKIKANDLMPFVD